ncbi:MULTISPECIES: glutaredoxin family protein [Nesterenkonia]|uniref:glutaredoxin family protein n=1 Tax=Nesterenkonia TaxID=57494 RepID=UPI001FF05F39|nr:MULTISPECIES: glutaredoxin family protein [Nesterenkonia]
MTDVEVLVKPGCHLCADAVAVTAEVCAEFGLEHRTSDISQDPVLAEQFAEEIPVLRIDGVPRDFWRFDAARLRRMLSEATG